MEEFIFQKVPHFDGNEADACRDYINSGGWMTEFRQARKFEDMIKEYTGAKYCFVVNNGTVSLVAALLAVGIETGDEVIVPNFTMIATPNAVRLIGARPVMVDVEERTLNLDLELLEKHITPKTKAIIHVSLNARASDMERLVAFCKERDLYLIEDAAQSLGSFHKGKHLGTFGDIGSFSFSPPKIISTGQGGALVTDNDELADKIKRIKDFGRAQGGNDHHEFFGINMKFTDLQATVGIEQMKVLPQRVTRMKEIWNIYRTRLKDIEAIAWVEEPEDSWIPWFIDIYVDDPEGLQGYMKTLNIGTRRVYPPIHTQPIYEAHRMFGDFPISTKWCNRGLWLPSSTNLTNQQIHRVCDGIIAFYSTKK